MLRAYKYQLFPNKRQSEMIEKTLGVCRLLACGAVHDRDLNAAKNIKAFGLKQYSPEGIRVEPAELRRLRRAKKQELSGLITI